MSEKFNGPIDYLDWRGDLPFAYSPFNDVDALLLCQLSYIPFDDIIPGLDRMDRITIERLAEKYFAREGLPGDEKNDKQEDGRKSSLGVLIPQDTFDMFEKMAKSVRFANVRAGFYLNDVNLEEEKQFCAVTFFIGEEIIMVTYRGTDDTIVGWKEDFNMSFMQTVPAQLEADRYFKNVLSNVDEQGYAGSIILGGHSKGGNLAVYAGMKSSKITKNRIDKIYNFDGPGFGSEVLAGEEYMDICSKVHTILPRYSVVGMLLGHEEDYTVVKSEESGLMQHNPLSWHVLGTDFVTISGISRTSAVIDKSLKQWVSQISPEQLENFVTAMFSVLGSSDAMTLSDLAADKSKSLTAMIKSYNDYDDETRTLLKETLKSLVSISGNTFKEFLTNTVKNNKIV